MWKQIIAICFTVLIVFLFLRSDATVAKILTNMKEKIQLIIPIPKTEKKSFRVLIDKLIIENTTTYNANISVLSKTLLINELNMSVKKNFTLTEFRGVISIINEDILFNGKANKIFLITGSISGNAKVKGKGKLLNYIGCFKDLKLKNGEMIINNMHIKTSDYILLHNPCVKISFDKIISIKGFAESIEINNITL